MLYIWWQQCSWTQEQILGYFIKLKHARLCLHPLQSCLCLKPFQFKIHHIAAWEIWSSHGTDYWDLGFEDLQSGTQLQAFQRQPTAFNFKEQRFFCYLCITIRNVTTHKAVIFTLSLAFKDEAQTTLLKKPSPYRTVNTFHLGYKNQSVYAVSGTSHCLFSDKYKSADRFI